MRTARYIQPRGGIYHVTAHTIETIEPYPLNETENERLYRLIRAMSGFTGVRVLTHGLMGNHFHLLLEVPRRPTAIPEDEVIRRLNCLPKRSRSRLRPGDELARDISRCRDLDMPESVVEAMLEPVRARMFDLSRFMQELLSRFTQNYNWRHERKGTLWDDRFHSTLVEPSLRALLTVAAYIDLNPLRAGLCDESLRYRFTGFHAARGGCRFAMEGLERLFAIFASRSNAADSPKAQLAAYHSLLTGKAHAPGKVHSIDLSGIPDRLEFFENLRYRRRYLSKGKILGSKIFVENLAAAWKAKQHLQHPTKPNTFADQELCVIHPLRVPV